MIVAVDGPAASGKGTLAKRLAAHYGLAYLDTGRTYRAVALALLREGAGFEDADAAVTAARSLDFATLSDPKLSDPEVGDGASRIAVMGELREVLVARQRAFATEACADGSGAVLDGRDIATAVCPDAAVKLYVTASVEERARRRTLELYGEADGIRYEALASALRLRDERDATRAASPLKRADDAVLIDTTELSAEEAFRTAIGVVDSHMTRREASRR